MINDIYNKNKRRGKQQQYQNDEKYHDRREHSNRDRSKYKLQYHINSYLNTTSKGIIKYTCKITLKV